MPRPTRAGIQWNTWRLSNFLACPTDPTAVEARERVGEGGLILLMLVLLLPLVLLLLRLVLLEYIFGGRKDCLGNALLDLPRKKRGPAWFQSTESWRERREIFSTALNVRCFVWSLINDMRIM